MNKCMIFSINTVFLLLFACAFSFAQGTQDVLNKIRNANSGKVIQYSYKVVLSANDNKHLDSSIGILVKNDNDYFDSSKNGVTVKKGNWVCKIDPYKRTVSVFDLNLISKKLGTSFSGKSDNILPIDDSVIAKYADIDVKKNESGNFIVSMTFHDQALAVANFEIEPVRYKVKSILFDVVEKDRYDEPTGYTRSYALNNVKTDKDVQAVKLEKYITITSGKVSVNQPYSNYKLTTYTK
jgi:hypothetical protein